MLMSVGRLYGWTINKDDVHLHFTFCAPLGLPHSGSLIRLKKGRKTVWNNSMVTGCNMHLRNCFKSCLFQGNQRYLSDTSNVHKYVTINYFLDLDRNTSYGF